MDLQLDERMIGVARDQAPLSLRDVWPVGWLCEVTFRRIRYGCRPLPNCARSALDYGMGNVGALEQMLARQASEAYRYQAHHGIDIGDVSIYDSVIDTETHAPAAVVETIFKALGAVV